MKLVCTMPVRNEQWCLGMTLRAVLRWVDAVIILDHASTDRTPDIIAEVSVENPGRVIALHEPDPCWAEMAHRQRMLDRARSIGATHIAIVDADEILSANLLPDIRGLIETTPALSILQLPWACLARHLRLYYTSGVWFNNWVATAFKDFPQACWQAPDGYDFHHRHPFGRPELHHHPITQRSGGLMHLQFVNERRLRAKQALYVLTEKTRWPDRIADSALGAMYGRAVYQSDPAVVLTESVPLTWWSGYEPLLKHYHPESEPWQEHECRRIVADHPGITAGLDLFGVV